MYIAGNLDIFFLYWCEVPLSSLRLTSAQGCISRRGVELYWWSGASCACPDHQVSCRRAVRIKRVNAGWRPCHVNAPTVCDSGHRGSPFVRSLSPGGVYKKFPTLKCVNCDSDVCDLCDCAGLRCTEVGFKSKIVFCCWWYTHCIQLQIY